MRQFIVIVNLPEGGQARFVVQANSDADARRVVRLHYGAENVPVAGVIDPSAPGTNMEAIAPLLQGATPLDAQGRIVGGSTGAIGGTGDEAANPGQAPPGPTTFPLEQESTFAGFLRGLGQTGTPTGEDTYAGRLARDQYSQALNAFRFSELLGGFGEQGGPFAGLAPTTRRPEETAQAFQDFVGNTGVYGGPRTAADIFTRLRLAGAGAGGSPTAGLGPNLQGFDALRGLFQQPTNEQAGALTGLAQSALGSRISPIALGLLNIPGSETLRGEFLNESGGAASGNFLDFLRKRLGLTRAGL